VFGKVRYDPVPMSVRTVCPGDKKDRVTLSHLDVMDIVTLNHHELIHTVLGFRISFVAVILNQIAAAVIQECPREH
jgi:hypothetical protein